jgi:hypothetical protein
VVTYDLTNHVELGRGTAANGGGALWEARVDGQTGYYLSTPGTLLSFDLNVPPSVSQISGPTAGFTGPPTLALGRIFIAGRHGYYSLGR